MPTKSQASAIAQSPEDRDQAYQLRYKCYRRTEAIAARPDERFTDDFDHQPNSFSFLVRNNLDEPMATVRISVVRPDLGWLDSPVKHVYGDHAALQVMSSESFVEASRLCFGPQARRDHFVALVGNMAALSEFYDTEWLVACPRTEHVSTYRRMFGFQPVAKPRQYFGVNFETQLLAIRREELRAWVTKSKPLANAWSDNFARITKSIAFPTASGDTFAY